MKRILFFYLILLFSFSVKAQEEEAVTWTTNYNPKTAEIEVNANILDGWHIFSQFVKDEIGPVPTQFSFEGHPALRLIGKVDEPEAIHQYDPIFEASVDYFENNVTFKQKISTTQSIYLKGNITFMACNEFQCMPPVDKKITIKITK